LDKRKAAATPMTELEAENSQLRQEVKKLRLEKEILKNAAAYFARELA
jgi:transposase-like protein